MTINKSPKAIYQALIDCGELTDDSCQLEAIQALECLFLKTEDCPTGLYFHGDVGRGKTRLMDVFVEAVQLNEDPALYTREKLLRCHFHQFMFRVHQSLREVQGQEEPLLIVSQLLADEFEIICLDEFFVADIGDAMLLYRLFDALFELGIVLVATSNVALIDLYKDGLHRGRFEPAIALLQANLISIKLDGEIDHRLRELDVVQTYFVNEVTKLAVIYSNLLDDKKQFEEKLAEPIIVCNRPIPVLRSSQNLVWFEFKNICEGARSPLDYIEIGSNYRHVFISGIPQLGGKSFSRIKARGTEDVSDVAAAGSKSTGDREVSYALGDNAARRFISMVDEFYEQRICLYLSAEVPLNELYPDGSLLFEFRRTFSRLIEMQSEQYLSGRL